MTLEGQVNAVTGLSIGGSSADPSRTELTQFIRDGVIEVSNRAVSLKSQDAELFQTVSGEQTANDSYTIKGKIMTVIREAGTDGDWRKCIKVPVTLQSKALDKESIHYASKYNPVYMIGDNEKVSVFPTPGSSNDGFKIYYINNDPKNNTDNAALEATHSDIISFPKEYVYLVVLYGSIKSLQAALSTIKDPAVGGVDEELTAAITAGTVGDATSQLDVSDWWDVAADLIETEEDPELGQVQIQKIIAYIQAWQQQLQGNISAYQWMGERLALIKGQYDAAFQIMAPQQSQQTQGSGKR